MVITVRFPPAVHFGIHIHESMKGNGCWGSVEVGNQKNGERRTEDATHFQSEPETYTIR